MHTLKGVGTNDDVGNRSTILENEDSVITTSVEVRVAWVTTIELLVSIILAASDDARRWERNDATNTAGDVESLSRRDAGDKRCELNLRELHLRRDRRSCWRNE
jgi:hypothetical protein